MVISDSSSVEKLTESVLRQIWYTSDDERIELYPLNEHPRRQLLPGIDRRHLYGLFYNLHLIKVRGSNTTLHESIDWNTKFPDFKFEKCRHGPANGKRTCKLILSACSQVHLRNFMPTEKEKDVMSNLRECYINRYDINNKVSPVTTTSTNCTTSRSSTRSMPKREIDCPVTAEPKKLKPTVPKNFTTISNALAIDSPQVIQLLHKCLHNCI
jgi:hypothetical protein